ncbi:MAG: hypothetical protein V1804_01815 [Patescibacteria group bacterium]
MGFETPTTKTPEEKLKGYEERTTKIAKEKGIDPEDIVRSDAKAEDAFYKKDLEKNSSSLLGQKQRAEYKDKIINSDVTFEYTDDRNILLKGMIKDGREIEIEVHMRPMGGRSIFKNEIIRSLADGKQLDPKEAEEIFEKYRRIGGNRSNRIDDAKWQKEDDERKLKEVRGKLDGKE